MTDRLLESFQDFFACIQSTGWSGAVTWRRVLWVLLQALFLQRIVNVGGRRVDWSWDEKVFRRSEMAGDTSVTVWGM